MCDHVNRIIARFSVLLYIKENSDEQNGRSK